MGDSYRLPGIVLEASSSKTWDIAVSEWHVVGCHDNGNTSESVFAGMRASGMSSQSKIPSTGKSSRQ